MFGLLFLFAFLSKCYESELPFENDDDDEIDDEAPVNDDGVDQDQDPDSITEEVIKKNEKEIKSVSEPTPKPVKIPIKDLVGKKEIIVACGIVFSVTYLIIARRYISKKIDVAYGAFSPLIREYFAVMPRNFSEKNYHEHVIYFSGRTGYIGGVCELHFRRCCDVLGTLFGLLTGDHNTIKFDMLLDPKYKPSGVMTIAKEKPLDFPDEFKLKEIPLSRRLKCFTDFGKERHGYLDLINAYISKSNTLEMLELTNGNRFDYVENSDWVAHFEFKVIGEWDQFINEELLQFVMQLSDKFTAAQFPFEIQSANERLRDKILKEKNGEKEPEKKLTKEEEAKLEKRKERREQNKFKPKFKTG